MVNNEQSSALNLYLDITITQNNHFKQSLL